jgi:hypothetical protein
VKSSTAGIEERLWVVLACVGDQPDSMMQHLRVL